MGGRAVSSTARGAERVESDFYPTPQDLADHVASDLRELWAPVEGTLHLLDPGAGTGRITRALRSSFRRDHIVSLELPDQHRFEDLVNSGASAVVEDDYLMPCESYGPFDLIVANPPFTHAEAFVRRSLSLMRDREESTVAMLVRLGFLASKEREDLFATFPHDAMRVCVPRPNFQEGQPEKHGDSADYAFLFWGKAPTPFFGRYRWRR